jgi:hypothetical protein
MATRFASFASLTLLLLLAAAVPAAGAQFVANIGEDKVDAVTGDGICDVDLTTMGDQCSLRAAVQTANETPAFDDVVLLNGVYTLSLSGPGEDNSATGDLDVTTPMEISSDLITGSYNTTFIEAKKLKDRIFDVQPGGDLDLRRASLLDGKTAKTESGGCVRSATDLNLLNVFLYRCSSSDDGGCVNVTGGTAAITNTIFSTCRAKDEGGGLALGAGTTATLQRTSAAACRAATGGAIASHGDLTLRDVTLDDNTAKVGAGIALLGAGPTTIFSTTITENGKANLDASQNTGAVTLSNTIVWGATTDCIGAITSGGGNLEGETSCGFTATNDQQSQDPQLAPYNSYGGFVPTRPPTKTVTTVGTVTTTTYSPAIDHGLDGATCLDPDARLVARQDVPGVGVAICDSGAAEFNFVP